ncbi:carbohydrate ABC transporter permease [Lacrimispora saccharolytica]|uniref:Binding-protein-dependent transport systems inner membrane component n=1 Tax=Lacrimispora saccharolytica (strain ATCC 35040 / DSM 2544 / NRCC 2533 / WM1) TaxID=610130 RepID=D9R2G5_LACSW|nr:carbohydrate ABC transporter permease [Lacrimispora saccharolytica]ADL06589.1 binding-protein-dependent transport systems inner membrane component [[Clostridium] saccharolyticum WM1]QRV19336.1 carbohydrate ABC transporter permease [Lacrimispora saccharolytica]
MKNQNVTLCTIVLAAVLGLFALTAVFPFLYMALLSFTQSKSLTFSLSEISLDFTNYRRVFSNTNFFSALRNSILVSGLSCMFNCLISSMAAYGFEKKEFPGKEKIFSLYLATLMVPGQVTLIPVFIIMKQLGLLNTYFALIVVIINAFGVFLIRQFMKGVPDELIEAAKVDGCPELWIFTGIVIPLIKPVLISLVVFTFISSWNDFIWPLVIATSSEMQTLTLALSLLKGHFSTNYGLVMAGSTLTFLFPFILYVFLQKQFVEGIALSGVKG